MLLDPHVGLVIWTIITFVVVLIILKAAVWKPLLGALDEREQGIADALASAEKARDEARVALDEHQKKLAEAEDEARQIVRQSREAAEKVHQDIVDKARADAQQTVDQARRSIDVEKRAALDDLRRQVADLAVQAAGSLLDANLDNDKNRQLVDDLISRIPESSSQNN